MSRTPINGIWFIAHRRALFVLTQSLSTLAVLCSLTLGSFVLMGQTQWQGGNRDWGDSRNWSDGVPGLRTDNPTQFFIGPISGENFPVIENADYFFSSPPDSIFQASVIGIGNNTNSRLDIRSGSLSRDTSDGRIGNFRIAFSGQGPVVNLADTAMVGQDNLTTYGQGSGSLHVRTVTIGVADGSLGTLNMNTSGSFSAALHITAGSMEGAKGVINLTSGALNTSDVNRGLVLGDEAGATGTLNMQGGSIGDGTQSNQRFIRVGRGGTGTFEQSGGVVALGDHFNSAVEIGEQASSAGTYTMTGGTATMQRMAVGMEGLGVLNVSGTADLTTNNNGALIIVGQRMVSGADDVVYAMGNGTVNLDGGRITTAEVRTDAANNQVHTSTFNFNGGTLRAGASNPNFFENLTEANILSGGAFIDTNGMNITIAQALQGGGDLTKMGPGTLTLSSLEDFFSGGITVEEGTLSLSSNLLNPATVVRLAQGAVLDLDFDGEVYVSGLIVNGNPLRDGTFTSTESFLTGSGSVTVIPEPTTVALFGSMAALSLVLLRTRRR